MPEFISLTGSALQFDEAQFEFPVFQWSGKPGDFRLPEHLFLGLSVNQLIACIVLVPLGKNLPARFQRFDWRSSQLAEWRTVSPQAFIIIEGVSATRREFKPFLAFSIYVETDRETRLRRGLRRDREEAKQRWLRWMKDEDDYLERDDPISSADLVVSGNAMSKYDPSRKIVALFP